MELDAAAVAARLGLVEPYRPWLDMLEAAGPPPGGLSLPRGQDASTLLEELGVPEPDRAEIVESLPSPNGQPELWWLLERSAHRLLRTIGRPEENAGPWAAFPATLGVQWRCFWIYVFLAAVPAARTWHESQGISLEVSVATLSDLGRHVRLYRRRNGVTGFDSPFWLSLHFRGGLYALGRLQYTPYRLRTGPAGPLFWYEGAELERLDAGFRPGDPALGVHIPEDGPLAPAACDESLQAAKAFFAQHFPEETYRIATCTSWLLDEQLAQYLPPASNLVRFQRRFELVPGARESDDAFRFVFGSVPASLDDLSPRTSLERALVEHARNGGRWHVRTGWLRL